MERHSEQRPGEESVGADRSTSRPAEAVGEPAIAVEGLTKRFGVGEDAVTAIDDVSFTVEEGSVVGLLGPNGA